MESGIFLFAINWERVKTFMCLHEHMYAFLKMQKLKIGWEKGSTGSMRVLLKGTGCVLYLLEHCASNGDAFRVKLRNGMDFCLHKYREK